MYAQAFKAGASTTSCHMEAFRHHVSIPLSLKSQIFVVDIPSGRLINHKNCEKNANSFWLLIATDDGSTEIGDHCLLRPLDCSEQM